MINLTLKDYADRGWLMNDLTVLGRALVGLTFTKKEKDFLISMLHTREALLIQYLAPARHATDKSLFEKLVDDKKTAHDLILKFHQNG